MPSKAKPAVRPSQPRWASAAASTPARQATRPAIARSAPANTSQAIWASSMRPSGTRPLRRSGTAAKPSPPLAKAAAKRITVIVRA